MKIGRQASLLQRGVEAQRDREELSDIRVKGRAFLNIPAKLLACSPEFVEKPLNIGLEFIS